MNTLQQFEFLENLFNSKNVPEGHRWTISPHVIHVVCNLNDSDSSIFTPPLELRIEECSNSHRKAWTNFSQEVLSHVLEYMVKHLSGTEFTRLYLQNGQVWKSTISFPAFSSIQELKMKLEISPELFKIENKPDKGHSSLISSLSWQ